MGSTPPDRLRRWTATVLEVSRTGCCGLAFGAREPIAEFRRGDPALPDGLEPPLLSIVSAARDRRLTP